MIITINIPEDSVLADDLAKAGIQDQQTAEEACLRGFRQTLAEVVTTAIVDAARG